MRAAWERVKARSEAISKLAGPFIWTPAAEKFFDTWYPTRKHGSDLTTDGYYETKDIFLIKIAMLIAISDGDELILDAHHFHRGLEILGLAEHNLSRVFQGIGRNELNHVSVKIMDILVNAPKRKVKGADGEDRLVPMMPLQVLRAMVWKDANGQDFDNVMTHLRSTEKIGSCLPDDGSVKKEYVFVKQPI